MLKTSVTSRRAPSPVLALACTLPLLLAACGGGGGGSSSSTGTLNVALSDAPSCGYDAVNVTVTGVAVHQSASAADDAAGWETLTLASPQRLNLLTLNNGVFTTLGQLTLPAGNYQQVRLILAGNSSASPLANSVVPTGGSETALDTPSAMQTGLKINTHLTVPDGSRADLLLDFKACESVVKRGSSGKYNLKPVLSAITDITLASPGEQVRGYIDPTLYASGARIALEQSGDVVRATGPDSTGQFILGPVPVGTYDLVITAPGRTTRVITGVPVDNIAPTAINTSVAPIVPPISATGVASGTVLYSTGNLIPPAHTAMWQQLTGGPWIQVGGQATDALTGAFAYTLPLSAPERTAYSAGSSVYSFAIDSAVGANYTAYASVPGVGPQTQAFGLSAAGYPLSFVFTAP